MTAPLRGDGFAKLRELADVVYDPWIDQTPLRIYTAEQLAERASAENADVLVVESDSVGGPVFDLPLRAIASTRGDPNNVDIAGATNAGIPVLYTPGRNADAVAEMAVALLFATTRHLLTADADVRAGQAFRDGTIPYQRFRAWEVAGQTAGLVGLGAVARALKWRLEGLGVNVIAHDPYNDEARHSLDELLAAADIVSLHAPVTDETVRNDRRRAVRSDARRRGLPQHRTGPAARHRRPCRRAAQRQGGGSRSRPFRRRMAANRPPADEHAQRGADAAYRRGHVEH